MKGKSDVQINPKNSSNDEQKDDEEKKEVRHVLEDLENIEDTADILQILIDQLQELDNKNTQIIQAKPTVETIREDDEAEATTAVTTSTTLVSISTTPTAIKPKPAAKVCGVKGGQYVEKSYGSAASKYILPLLIDSWVFGKEPVQRARYDDSLGRISGGKVTSTVLYCWVAAILTKEGEFVCTGTLVAEDLVITSGSCINLYVELFCKTFCIKFFSVSSRKV